MKKTVSLSTIFAALVVSASAADVKSPEAVKLPALATHARTVVMHAQDVIEINCSVNVPTMIALPEGEEALVVQGGDAAPDGTWLYQTASAGPARRYVAVKPSVVGSSAVLHIISSHNIPYSFAVKEVSNTSAIADISVFVNAGQDMANKVNQAPVLVTAEEANRYKHEAAEAEARLEQERKSAAESLQTEENLYRTTYSKTLDHGYRFDRLRAPFNVLDIATDGQLTFVYVDPRNTSAAAVYTEEGKKKKANLPNYDYDAQRGVYTIQGVVTRGYLAVKDSRLDFARLANGQ